MMLATTTAVRPPLVTSAPTPFPGDLPPAASIPDGTIDHAAPERWFEWNLATISQPAGFDPGTGEPLTRRTRVVLAPYPEFRNAVELGADTPFRDVVAVARARAGRDLDNAEGSPQAVLQAWSGAWYVATAGVWDGPDHIEPLPIDWARRSSIRQAVRELKAIVDRDTWVDLRPRVGAGAAPASTS